LWLLLPAAVLANLIPVVAQESPPPPVVEVRLSDAGGVPVVDVEVQFFYEDGRGGGSCITDAGGCCEITLPAGTGGEWIRGYLVVGEAGRRSLIWPGGAVMVELRIQADGTLYVPTGVEDVPLPRFSGDGGDGGDGGDVEMPTALPQGLPTSASSDFSPSSSPTSLAFSPTPVRSEAAVSPPSPETGTAGGATASWVVAVAVVVVLVVLVSAGAWLWRRG